MPVLTTILHYAGFGKRNKMPKQADSPPSDILQHRYQDPQVLKNYLKALPRKFTDDQIKIQPLKDGRLGLWLPRKLEQDEIDGALQAFLDAERERQRDDEE